MPLFTNISAWPKAEPPIKIVSLVPSITETLHDLGLEEDVIGITKFCVHPVDWFQNKVRIGGTKNINVDLIRELEPDLVIANKEENVADQVMEVAGFTNVWLTDIVTYEDALVMIRDAGVLTGCAEQGAWLVSNIRKGFESLNTATADVGVITNVTADVGVITYITREPRDSRLKCAYLIWRKPYMAAGGDTYIHHMLTMAGFQNVFADTLRYPETNIEEIIKRAPDVILLSSEPYPFGQKHIGELSALLPGTRVVLVDGEMFSWYGTRMLHAPAYFSELISSLKQYH